MDLSTKTNVTEIIEISVQWKTALGLHFIFFLSIKCCFQHGENLLKDNFKISRTFATQHNYSWSEKIII